LEWWKPRLFHRTDWRRRQSLQTGLHNQNSLLAGTLQGTFAIPRRLARKRPEQPTEMMSFLRGIPYACEQRILFDELTHCREFKFRCSELKSVTLHSNQHLRRTNLRSIDWSLDTNRAMTLIESRWRRKRRSGRPGTRHQWALGQPNLAGSINPRSRRLVAGRPTPRRYPNHTPAPRAVVSAPVNTLGPDS
jgi:hypothetical protein